jgi:hypothetical protein
LVETYVMRETDISNQPFFIPANQKITFYMSSGVLKNDMFLISVQPHAHQLCKSFKAYAITPDGDLIPLVKINDWDFNWQETYSFKGNLHIPKGSVILVEALYDNTNNNVSNPNNPPIDVKYGWRSQDEMMNIIFNHLTNP